VKYPGFRKSAVLSAIGAVVLSLPAYAADWKPVRPINLIVPWAAGGSTDQITRLVAGEMEKSLGQTIVIINQPGASGSIGTRSALEAAKDGYTWTAGAAQDLGAYQTLGSLDSSIKDWHLFLSVANVQVIGVNPKTPYQNAKELLDAMKANPGKISVATAGVTSAGHNAMELIAKVDNVKYRHVTYDGGNPAAASGCVRSPPSATGRSNSRATAPSRHCRRRFPASRRRPIISASSFPRACRTR
jgi:tripartite-type tricarboxylate transporter receptor subunit TctC